jgi:gamma-glutamylcyclotransferase
MKTNIFVYGTLRQQFGNHHFLSTARFLGDAITQSKYVMHASSSIPFVSQSQAVSQIVGEVYEVDVQTLANLDRLEGCRVIAEEPLQFDANSWYTREQVSVRWADGGECLTVWMYFNEHETRHAIIPTGDFKDLARFLNSTDRVWYFAYGSNMNLQRMMDRSAYFTQRKRGILHGHRLVFNKISGTYPGHGVANVVAERGYDVVGVLYEVDRPGIEALDGHEGVRGGHYIRTEMLVQLNDGTSVNAFVYVAHPNKVEDGLTPHDDYFYHLEQGLDLLGEGGADYLKQARLEARVTDDERFLAAQDIPTPSHDDYLVDVRNHALPVLLNGQKVKMYFYNGTWSERLVFHCEPEVAPHIEAMDLRVDELGFFGTKRFNFLRRGILEIGHHRLVVELDS